MHERQGARPAGRGYPGPLDTGLSGTGLVADDLYLLAHDDRTGRPLLPPRPLGTGLAGALLAELMLAHLYRAAVRHRGHDPPRRAPGSGAGARAAEADRRRAQPAAGTGVAGVPDPYRGAGRGGTAGAGRVPDARPQPGPGAARPDGPGEPRLGVRADAPGPFRPGPAPGRSPRTRGPWPGWRSRAGWASAWTSTRTRAGRSTADAVAYLPPDLRQLITQTQITVSSAVLSHRT